MQSFDPPLRLGLQPIAIADWLRPLDGDGVLLGARREILARHSDSVAAERPEAAAAVAELWEHLIALSRVTGPVPSRERMAGLGARIAEDLCVLTADSAGTLRLTAAVVCFPNRWRLKDKIGTTMMETHGPVPDYASTVGASVDRFLGRLKPLKPYVRSNWGVTATDGLFTPDPTPPLDPLAGDGFVRREDQSFLKLPVSGAVVFSIRTSFAALSALSAEDRGALAESIKNLSPAWRHYKSLRPSDTPTE